MDADDATPRRRKDDERTLRVSAKRYLQSLEQDDLYMTSNYFHEMFRTMWISDDSAEPTQMLLGIEQRLKRILDDTIGHREHIHQRYQDDFEMNFDLCRLQHLPKEFERRGKRERIGRAFHEEE